MRSYSGTADLLRYAALLQRSIHNAWCATSLFWFNVVDGRGPLSLRDSIADHMALMRWHGERDIPVEGNEPHHWELRDGHDAVACAAAYLYAYVARAMGVRDYIATYMFETPLHLSNRMDLAKQLAKAELAESLADVGFRVWRQTRTGLMSYPLDVDAARGHLGASIYLQMAMRPHVVHVVGYCEADHAARPGEVIASCQMARRAIENALRGAPDMTADPAIQQRKERLKAEAMAVVEGIRALGAGAGADPLLDADTLARAVSVGLLDAPHLRGSPHACGQVRTQAIDGAILAVDEWGQPVTEQERVDEIVVSCMRAGPPPEGSTPYVAGVEALAGLDVETIPFQVIDYRIPSPAVGQPVFASGSEIVNIARKRPIFRAVHITVLNWILVNVVEARP
jgi:hypothetical protein